MLQTVLARPTPLIRCWILAASCLVLSMPTVQAAGAPPQAPSELAGAIVDGTVSLTWTVPTDSDDAVEGYNVYINNQYATTVTTNSYTGSVEPDTLFSFYVVAFDEPPRRFSQASESLTLPESLIPDDLTIPPSIPMELAGSVEGATVSLSWEPSTDDEAVLGYNVYRDNQYLTTVSSNSYSGSNEPDQSHSWYVVAFDVRSNFSPRSDRIVLPDPGPVDTTLPPSVPTGLSGDVDAGSTVDTVTLTWTPSTDDQAVAGYNIYRNRQYIATRFSEQYTGTVDAGSSNNFSVVAFDFDGNFSATSESLTLPLGTEEVDPGVPPSIPQGLAGETNTNGGQTQVQLSWQPSTSSVAVTGYNVYRNRDYLTTVFTNAYSDVVTAGTAFSYTVVAFDDFGNFSAQSAPLNLLGDANQPPFFSDLSNQNLMVGEPWELLLRPVDIDGGAAGILVSTLPVGMEFIDNQNGSRSLRWTPQPDDVGSYDITATAFDLQDADLRTSQTFTLTVADDDTPAGATFNLTIAQAAYNLQEGNSDGVNIPISISRNGEQSAPISLSVTVSSETDARGLTTRFSQEVLSVDDSDSTLNLQLAIDMLPILSSQRRITVTASDGSDSDSASVTVAVTPVARDDVYLLIGQSNMEGFSEANAKAAGAGEADAPDLRIRQANVEMNDSDLYLSADDYTNTGLNFLSPAIVTAEDPLHDPVDPSTLAKEGTRIGLGLSFAKRALAATSRNIILVPAAWAGSGFCNTPSPAAHWNPVPTNNPALGNTLLFDRALARVNETLAQSGGILRGIIWHQGENDSTGGCAPLYEQNLALLASELRSRINEDARGPSARGTAASIPFVVGTMSQGIDERGDLSDFSASKSIVDAVHRNIANIIPYSEVLLTDDLVPANGFPCGQGSCIHFGATALREMGVRAYDSLLRAAAN